MESPNRADAQTELAELLPLSVLATETLILRRQVSEFLAELGPPDERRSLDLDRGISLRDEVRRFEIRLIKLALKRSGGSQQRAARMLNLKPSTLCAKLKSYGILIEEMRP